ncbi:hypothetical protein P3T22_006632 [Paraburkholderia sp. GAS348]
MTLLSVDQTMAVLHRQARAHSGGHAQFVRAATGQGEHGLCVHVQWSRTALGGSGYTYLLNGQRVDEQAVRTALTAARTA